MNKLSSIELQTISARIKSGINDYCAETMNDDHRNHLGASIIGHECARHIWYAFRWAKLEIFSGRMLRLFERGQREEHAINKLLQGVGFKVWNVDETGKQFRITGSDNHYGGSADGVGIIPYPELHNLPVLLEMKTHNRGSFAHLLKHGVILGKPRHYAQMCAYGVEFGFQYGLYFAVNKDDDDIHTELVFLDPIHADDLRKKASDIIYSQFPPPKISLQPEYFECKFCVFTHICHDGYQPEKNCRSCRHAMPAPNAEWGCNKFGQIIPKEFIPLGCGEWWAIGE